MKLSSLSFIAPFVLAAQIFAQAPVAPAAPATAAAWPTDQAGLTTLASTLINGWFAKIAANDQAGISQSMQPNMQLIDFQGSADLTQSLVKIKGLASKSPSKATDVIATRVGDALVATCLLAVNQSVDGKNLPSSAAPRIGVWQIVNGSWQMAAWGSLHMPEVRPAPSAPAFAGDAALNAEGSAMLTKFLAAQQTKNMTAFDAMLADGMQVVNFKGQKVRADMVKGASMAKTQPPIIADARTTRCGDLTIVTCNLTMGQSIAFNTLPADPAPFLTVFQGSGDSAKVIAIANTNKPK